MSLPMTLIEAQACGLPSVVFDFQYGASDIIVNGRNGHVVEQGNNKLFVAAVVELLSSETMRTDYGTHALETGKHYSKENIFSKWVAIIKGL